jgi:hypothetical protein
MLGDVVAFVNLRNATTDYRTTLIREAEGVRRKGTKTRRRQATVQGLRFEVFGLARPPVCGIVCSISRES